MMVIVLVALVLLHINPINGYWHCDHGPCLKGQYLNTTGNLCESCQPGYYMDLENHTCYSCFECMKPEEHYEVTIKQCSADSNAKIGCVDGYFYIEDEDKRVKGSCNKCSICGDKCVPVPCENNTGVPCCSCRYTEMKREPPEESQCAFSRKNKVIFQDPPPTVQVATTQQPDIKYVQPVYVADDSSTSSPKHPVVPTLRATYDLDSELMRYIYVLCFILVPISIVCFCHPAIGRCLRRRCFCQ